MKTILAFAMLLYASTGFAQQLAQPFGTPMPVLAAPTGTLGTAPTSTGTLGTAPTSSGTIGTAPTRTCFPCTDPVPQPSFNPTAGTIGLAPRMIEPKPVFASPSGHIGWDRWGLYK